jgi:hypothetical protein
MKLSLLLAASLIVPLVGLSQDKLIKSVALKGTVVFAAVDRPGDLYIIMSDGLIRKFDKNGIELATKKFDLPPTLFDPRDGTMSFAYFRKEQKLVYLSPDMSSSDEKSLNPEFAINAWQVCPTKNELWILDSADMSLKQTIDRGSAIAYDATWTGEKPASAGTIMFMREYLNFLFVLDSQGGLHMFNHLGKPIRHIKEKDLPWFNFLGEELYYPKSNSLYFIDLYTGEERELPMPNKASFVLLTDERMMVVTPERVEFRTFKP